MRESTPGYKKTVPFLIIFFIVSYFMISSDRHYGWFCPTCTVCQANVSFNGCQDAVTLEFYSTITHFSFVEKPLAAFILTPFHFNDRVSPEHIFQSNV